MPQNPLRLDRPERPRCVGLSLLELMLTLLVLMTAVAGTLGSVSTFVAVGQAADEEPEAFLALQSMLEELMATELSEVYSRYNGDPSDDPSAQAQLSPGPLFELPGLRPRNPSPAPSDPARGLRGAIRFPEDPAHPGVLREDLRIPELGLPRDLNLDGVIDGENHALDYRILPVQVRVEWRSESGNRMAELTTLLGAR